MTATKPIQITAYRVDRWLNKKTNEGLYGVSVKCAGERKWMRLSHDSVAFIVATHAEATTEITKMRAERDKDGFKIRKSRLDPEGGIPGARNMTTHIMCDLETLGTRPGCVVLAAAFVRFSDGAHTSLNISVPDQQSLGLEIDPVTHAWWGTQDSQAWQLATQNPTPLVAALNHFDAWLAWASQGDDWLIWCHGATFDCPILGELYRRAGREAPWKFWNIRDTRTLYDLAGINVKDFAVPPPHVALNDAIGQTNAANSALRILAAVRAVA